MQALYRRLFAYCPGYDDHWHVRPTSLCQLQGGTTVVASDVVVKQDQVKNMARQRRFESLLGVHKDKITGQTTGR